MANDREVLREVWEGRLPIKFSLAEEDKVSLTVYPDCAPLVVLCTSSSTVHLWGQVLTPLSRVIC